MGEIASLAERLAAKDCVTVELYGIPRARAGCASACCSPGSLADILRDLAERFPELGRDCIRDGKLVAGYTANLNGQRFLVDTQALLGAGETLLILTADAGG